MQWAECGEEEILKSFQAKIAPDADFLAVLGSIETACGRAADGFDRANQLVFFTGEEDDIEAVCALKGVESVEEATV